MKKKTLFKKMVALTMVTTMAFSLAACGGTSKENEGTEENVLKIGCMGPLTGSASLYGNSVKEGAEIAVEEINAMGGELKIEFQVQDDEADSEKGVNAYNKLKDWGMDLILGAVTTGSCIAVASEAYNDRIFELTPSASSADVTANKDNVFQLCFTDPNQGKTAASYFVENFPDAKVGIIYNNSDAYSTGIANAFKTEMAALGGNVVASETYPDDTNNNFTAQLNACKVAGADYVFLPIYYTPASIIFNQAEASDYHPTFFGTDGMDGILTLEKFDTQLAEGVLLMTPFNPWSQNERVVSFVEKYQSAYGTTPNQFAADGYDCVYALYEAFVESGCTTDMQTEEICDAMVNCFTGNFTYDGLTGASMTWSTGGEVSKTPMVCEIKNGVYADR